MCIAEHNLKGIESPLSEYNTVYGDGKVETYIAIPEIPTPFAIRLKSIGWIASGLAMVSNVARCDLIARLLISNQFVCKSRWFSKKSTGGGLSLDAKNHDIP